MTSVSVEENVVECALVLSGRDFDPELCSSQLGLSATAIWRQRHEHLKHRIDLPNVEWEFALEEEGNDNSVDWSVFHLGQKLLPFSAKIGRFAGEYGLKVSVVCRVIVYNVPAPACFLSKSSVAMLAKLGAEFSWSISNRTEL